MLIIKTKTLQWIVLFLFIVFAWTLYRYIFQFPEWMDEFVAKPIIQLLPVLFAVKFFAGKPVINLGLSTKRMSLQIFIGIGIGAFLVIEAFYLKKISFGVISLQTNNYILPAMVSLATGLVEEIVYRGYFMGRILESIENIYIANFIQTILFVLIHIPLMMFTFHYSMNDILLYSLQICVLGYIFGFVRILTDSIFPSTIAHAMWNLANVLFQ